MVKTKAIWETDFDIDFETKKRFKNAGEKLEFRDRQALAQFLRPAFYGTIAQCPK